MFPAVLSGRAAQIPCERLMAFFAVGVEDRDLGGMNMILVESLLPMGVPTRPMIGVVKAGWYCWEKSLWVFEILLRIGADNRCSHPGQGFRPSSYQAYGPAQESPCH